MEEIVYLPVAELYPHPANPRKELGDLTELSDSLKANGIMQNLTVVPRDAGGYTVIIGHRRAAAARAAGIEKVPCIVRELTMMQQVQIMLVENMQRTDLTPFEQAKSMQQLVIDFGATPEDIAAKTGFSVRTVKHRLEIAKLDADKLRAAQEKQITIGALEDIEQIRDISKREKVLEAYGTPNYYGARIIAINEQKVEDMTPGILETCKKYGIDRVPKSKEGKMYGDYDYGRPITLPQGEDKLLEEIKAALKSNARGGKIYVEISQGYAGQGILKIWYTKPKPQAEKATEKSPEEKRRTGQIKLAEDGLAMICTAMHRKRMDFVAGLAKKRMMWADGVIMLRAFARLAVRNTTDWIPDPEFGHLTELLHMDTNGLSRSEARDKILVSLDGINDQTAYRTALMALMASYKDTEKSGAYWQKGHGDVMEKDAWPKPSKPLMIEEEYSFLIAMGYEMSEDEERMRLGTSELFKDPMYGDDEDG